MIAFPDSWSEMPTDSDACDTTLVYVHGFGCARVVWNGVADELARGFRQIFLDLPGHGPQGAMTYDLLRHRSLDGMAEHVAEVLMASHPERPGRTVLVGHSIGCNIAWRVALAHPDKVSDLVLINASPCFRNLAGYGGGFAEEELRGMLDLMVHNPLQWSQSLSGLVAGGSGAVASWLAESFCKVEPDCLRHFSEATFFVDDRELLRAIAQPCLLLSNRRDSLVPLEVHRFMASAIRRNTEEVLDIAGHAAHMTHPFLVAEAMRRFLR